MIKVVSEEGDKFQILLGILCVVSFVFFYFGIRFFNVDNLLLGILFFVLCGVALFFIFWIDKFKLKK